MIIGTRTTADKKEEKKERGRREEYRIGKLRPLLPHLSPAEHFSMPYCHQPAGVLVSRLAIVCWQCCVRVVLYMCGIFALVARRLDGTKFTKNK
mmetsp:Transcript_264/g.344  ORF Transcript_264/g.344 Transcript_264/m.344 type:complete len:94 (-) Transcript_264:1381-1662(-)